VEKKREGTSSEEGTLVAGYIMARREDTLDARSFRYFH